MIGVNDACGLIEICATRREKGRTRLIHHVLAREDLLCFHGRLLFTQIVHVGPGRLPWCLEQLANGSRVCSRQLVLLLMVQLLLRCDHPLGVYGLS